MFALTIIGTFVVAIFAIDIARTWWRENEWKRRWRRRGPGGDSRRADSERRDDGNRNA